jgi:cell wall-associated NlpC family hydrolase
VMNIANNHSGDFGLPGKESTMRTLNNANLSYAGLKDVCETARFQRNGIKFGFCGFAPNASTVKITDIAYAKKLVSELKQDCDIVIVSFHGGAEGPTHNRVTKKTETFYGENRGNVHEFAHAVIDAGADIVFGHGPHVVRAVELYKDRFIIYSLGNFCTPAGINIAGVCGYAPMVKVYTDKTGRFVKGQIYSAIQKDKTGPALDENNIVTKEIKRLTQLDFPDSQLLISDEGLIERKDLKLTENSEPDPVNDNLVSDDMVNMISDIIKTMTNTAETTVPTAQNIIDYSRKFLNKPYKRGQKGPNAFDCSGFTYFVFKNFGFQLGASCNTQINDGLKIDKNELRMGDLIFFKGRDAKSSRVGHVGIVVSNEQGSITFIHACSRGVIVEELNQSAYYKPRYITGLRVLT